MQQNSFCLCAQIRENRNKKPQNERNTTLYTLPMLLRQRSLSQAHLNDDCLTCKYEYIKCLRCVFPPCAPVSINPFLYVLRTCTRSPAFYVHIGKTTPPTKQVIGSYPCTNEGNPNPAMSFCRMFVINISTGV